jgi:uncharacterized RDD family membrane protein YckC
LSKCLKCGAVLPPVGECPSCAAAVGKPTTPAVSSLLNKDISIDRRRTPPESPAAVTNPAVPSFSELARGPATPPGMTPARQAAPPPPMPQRTQAPPSVPVPAAPSRVLLGDPDSTLPDTQPEMPALQPAAAMPHGAPGVPAPAVSARAPVDDPDETAPGLPPFAPVPQARPPVSAAKMSAPPKSAQGPHEVHARPAQLWRRLLSFSVDTAAIVGVALLYILLASSIAGVKSPSSQGLTALDSLAAWMHALKSVLLPGVFLLLVLATVYSAVAAFLWNGRTLGRLLLGLRLVDTHGLAPEPSRAIVRALLSVVSFGLFLGGFWMALFDKHGQTLHDKLTSTFVIQPS